MGILKPSTRKFVQEARKNSIPWYEILHGYIYGRWTYFYIAMGTGRHPLAKYFTPLANWLGSLLEQKIREEPGKYVSLADTYHGKAIPLETARQLVLVNEPIRLPDLEKVIPYKRARALILDNPGHIVALNCPCRSAKPNPCQPIDVCLIVGEPFASFVIEHNPNKARWISPGEAEEILQAENARGHVQHAFFKDAMLGRFYAICNCCSCCCGAIEAHQRGMPMLASSGFVAQVNEDLCAGCGNCETACPFGAVSLPEATSLIDQEKCMGCGVCVEHCTVDAISLRRDPAKGEPLEIPGLMEAAATN